MENEAPRGAWRCDRCGTLLGIEREGDIELKYKDAYYRVRGEVMARCRRCGAECRIAQTDTPEVLAAPE